MLLDATAGNRMMWPNKTPPHVIFIDWELRLARPPHVFADNRFCPFRDNVFDCIIYDPPFQYDSCPPPWWNTPNKTTHGFYGFYKTRLQVIIMVSQAINEFKRLSSRLVMKWNDNDVSLWSILSLFRDWREIHRRQYTSRAGGKYITYWVTFVKHDKKGI